MYQSWLRVFPQHFVREGTRHKVGLTIFLHHTKNISTSLVFAKKADKKFETLTPETFVFTAVKPQEVTQVLSAFRSDKKIQLEAKSHGLTKSVFQKVFNSFSRKLAKNDLSVLSMKANH
uniref:Uncharacterized protein n=1 Tax=Ciona savignyi TaxID=51511 RepID=H2YNN5_CIOSA